MAAALMVDYLISSLHLVVMDKGLFLYIFLVTEYFSELQSSVFPIIEV